MQSTMGRAIHAHRARALPMLLTQEIPLHCELVTTTPPQQAPLLLLKKKKKIKKHSTRLCGHSTAAPCGHLRSELTVWPVWLPLWVGKGKLVRWARFTEARQLGRSLGPRQSRDLGWVMEEQVEEGHYQEQPDTEQGEWQPQCPADLILPQLSPWDRGGRRCELECANFLNHASLECVSNTRRGAL